MTKRGHTAFLAGLWIGLSGATPPPLAHIESGIVQGVREGGNEVYKGVPFAAAPLNQLRWQEPHPVMPWTGVRKTEVFAPACMQKGVSMPGETPPEVSEDCLYLNIWTPVNRLCHRLPVVVWIHGGAYSNGSTSLPLYWGDRLARRGIVVVTIAYRLGPLGFLAHPELTQESPKHSSGNYGLMDQIAALEWIQHNIANFGGDPRRVTIAGQSAGAMSVSLLMASPRARGLFQQAIGQSGGVFEPLPLAPSYLLINAERDGVAYAASVGADSLAALRALPAANLLEGTAHSVTHPVVDQDVLPRSPYDAWVSGHYSDVPLLVGFNTEEARSLVDVASVRAETFEADLTQAFGPLPSQITAAYPHETDDEARQARLDLERDLRFGWDMWAWARLHAMAHRHPVYFYSFAHRPAFPTGSVYENWGASHFAELWFVFDHLGQASWSWSPADHEIARIMSSYWVNFAKTGDPNGPGLPSWPTYLGTNDRILELGDPAIVKGVPNLDQLQVFDEVYSVIRGAPFGVSREAGVHR